MVQVTRRVRFAAARRLESTALDDAANQRLFGADRRLHGREFELFVTLEGTALDSTGMVMDLKALSRVLKAEVVARLDRTLLNDVELLVGLPPTTENLVVQIWRGIESHVPPDTLNEVRLTEGEERTVIYRGE